MANESPLELTPAQLRRSCSPDEFVFADTSEIAANPAIFGQQRGVDAIEFGVDIDLPGYNLYVLGPVGSGRLTAVQHFINERAADDLTPEDWCYVYNFKQVHKPTTVRLPAGQGRQLQADMDALIVTLRAELARVFEAEVFTRARSEITNRFQEESQSILEQIHQVAMDKGFLLQASTQGLLVLIPVKDDKPVPPDEFETLPEEEQESYRVNRQDLQEVIEEAFRSTRALKNKAESALETLRRDTASQVIDTHMGVVLQKYDTSGTVIQYFRDVREDILQSLDKFQQGGERQAEAEAEAAAPTPGQPPDAGFENRYSVNVLVENMPDTGAPVVMLDLPTYQNLVGRIEYEVKFGMLSTDFTYIKSGALHRANGGFLIIRALDILRQPFAWEALKRALNSRQVVIEDPDTRGMTVMATRQLEPEPIPLNVKVVLVGSPELYYLLYQYEESFPDLFRVKADFGDVMNRTSENISHYAEFIATRCHEEKLPHFDPEAVARVVDYGSWLVSDQQKLSTQFGQIAPLIYESAFYARRNKHTVVTAADVERAIASRIYRSNQPEELSRERIERGTIFIDVTGDVVGQVNGLVVISMGDYTFGLPSRLTARVYMGRKDVVQIDRESRLTGPIHDKGVLILQGYLGGHYAHDYPLTLTASLTFEQSYGGVEGDSASSTELYALLSALSGFPIRQEIAVTGSVNQHGQIQPIGGATQKIEGFFAICKTHGLTGNQGVIIPSANVTHLMLNAEVIQAVQDGMFHIYAVETVDEGIALLTGKSANAVHEAVDKRLRYLAQTLAEFEDRRHR